MAIPDDDDRDGTGADGGGSTDDTGDGLQFPDEDEDDEMDEELEERLEQDIDQGMTLKVGMLCMCVLR